MSSMLKKHFQRGGTEVGTLICGCRGHIFSPGAADLINPLTRDMAEL